MSLSETDADEALSPSELMTSSSRPSSPASSALSPSETSTPPPSAPPTSETSTPPPSAPSPSSPSPSNKTPISKVSTINEDFYNSLNDSYISDVDDTDHEDCSDTSSDTPVPFLSPEAGASKPPAGDPNKMPPRSNSLNQYGNSGHDTLAYSENSGSRGSHGNKRDITGSSELDGEDLLKLSDRSNPQYRDSTGFNSLQISETTDETWRRIINYDETSLHHDDASSISSTPSTPFPNLGEGRESFGHSKGTEKQYTNGESTLDPGETPPLSQRIIEVIESPPLADAPMAPDLSNLAVDDALASQATDEEQLIEDQPTEDQPTKHQPTEEVPTMDENEESDPSQLPEQDTSEAVADKTKAQSSTDTINETNHPVEIETVNEQGSPVYPVVTSNGDENNNENYNGSISTTRSLRDNERDDCIPRRWIFDRIDGTVKTSGDEEEQLPIWKRKPPFYLCLPSPLLGVFPWLLEENYCCVTVGKWGFFSESDSSRKVDNTATTNGAEPGDASAADSIANNESNNNNNNESTVDENLEKKNGLRRTVFLAHALLLNACGLFATILSGLSLSRSNMSLLEAAPFAKTTVVPDLFADLDNNDSAGNSTAVTLYLGLLALGIDNPLAETAVVIGVRDFCETSGTDQFLQPGYCDRCADAGIYIVLGFFLAAIAYLPTFAIGISRLYKNYDANCSKASAGLWSLMSLTGYFMVLSCYYLYCQDALYEGEVLYTIEGAIYEESTNGSGEQILRANFDWNVGVGQILFLIGLGLKSIDFASNCCIATPAITRSRSLQWDYEEGFVLEGEDLDSGNPQEGPNLDQTNTTADQNI